MSTLRPALPSGRRPYLAVPYYDGRTRDTVLDQYGVHRGVHPTDSGMAMSLMVRQGSIKSDPSIGSKLRDISDLGAPNLAEQIRVCVESALPLSRLVSEGKARIERIDFKVERSKLAVWVYYTNLDTGERPPPVGWYT